MIVIPCLLCLCIVTAAPSAPLTDDDFVSTLQNHKDYHHFLTNDSQCESESEIIGLTTSRSTSRSTLSLLYPRLPDLIRLLSTPSSGSIKRKTTTLWLHESALIHVGNLNAALQITRQRYRQQKKNKMVTAACLLDHALRLLRLIQGNTLQYLVFKGHDQQLKARNAFFHGCQQSGGQSSATINKLIDSIQGEQISTLSASTLVCQCLGKSIHSQQLWPTFRSRRYHELELSKMLWAASASGLDCMVDPIVASAKRHPGSGSDTVNFLLHRLPLEFTGAPLHGDESMKLPPFGTAATYGWTGVLRKMLDNGACIPRRTFQLILTHVDSIFENVMPLLIKGTPCTEHIQHNDGNSWFSSTMQEVRKKRAEIARPKPPVGAAPDVYDYDYDSGWQHRLIEKEKETHMKDIHECDIDEIYATDIVDETQLLMEYVYGNKPVVLRGALYSPKFDNIRQLFRKQKLMKELSQIPFRMSEIPYPELFLRTSTKTTLSSYFDLNETTGHKVPPPKYIFVPCPESVRRQVTTTIPSVFGSHLPNNIRLCEFYVGSKGTGSPAHFHVLALNFLIHGMKKWLLAPPSAGFHARKPAFSYWKEDVPELLEKYNVKTKTLLRCTQKSGDVFLVPRFWMHSTLNIRGDSIGYALEFTTNVVRPNVKQPPKDMIIT